MKTSTKIGLGFSVAAIAGVYVATSLSEKFIDKMEQELTRHKAKKIVREKFSDNEKLLAMVDDLSGDELESIEKVVKDLKNSKEKINDYGKKVKNSIQSVKNELSE